MITFPQAESCGTPEKSRNRASRANEFDLSCWIDSGGGHTFEIDRGNLLIEENVLVGHAHRKRDSEVRVNDSEVPRGRGDSGLTTGVHVVHARELRGGSYSDAEVDAPDLANRSEELPIPRLLGVMDRRRAQKFVTGAISAGAAIVHRRIPLLESDEQDEVHLLGRIGVAEEDRVLEFRPPRPEPFRETMESFFVLDNRGLNERLRSFEEELPSALRSGHRADGAHLRDVRYDFCEHLVLVHL